MSQVSPLRLPARASSLQRFQRRRRRRRPRLSQLLRHRTGPCSSTQLSESWSAWVGIAPSLCVMVYGVTRSRSRHPVGFVVLILAYCLISRFPCFRQPQGVPPTLLPPRSQPWTHIDAPNHEDNRLSSFNAGRDLHNHNYHMNGPRRCPRPPIHHVDLTVFSMHTFTEHQTQHFDRNAPYLPPYGGPSPPPYPEALQHPPQYLHSPPRAVVEA